MRPIKSNIIEADLYRYNKCKSISMGMKYPGFCYTYYYRQAARYKNVFFLGTYYRYMLRRLSIKYGFQIPPSTTIGPGLYLGHFGSIVINKNTKIGKNCNIAHSTTIGQTNRGSNKGCPTIGDNVWIGTGAVIVGGISIGNNVLIAPNSFVNIDIPDNAVVIGNPATFTSRLDAVEGYINNTL